MTAFAFKSGAHIRASLDPQAVGEELEQLRTEYREGFTPELVVEKASSEASAMHAHFSWDVTGEEARQRLLESEAAHLIRAVQVVVVNDQEREITAPAFVSVVTRDTDERSYIPTVVALTDDEYRSQVLGEAVGAFMALRRRYRDLDELNRIFAAVDQYAEERELVTAG